VATIHQLKAKVYALAGVRNTQQLEANYRAIGDLDLRLKSSWQQAIALLEANPTATPVKSIHDLKSEVYALAQVSSTKALKRKYNLLRALNFSYKASWETALTLLRGDQSDFQAWLDNPPEEYKALFADIEAVTADFGAQLVKAKHLGKDALEMAESLEDLAQDAQAEADSLRRDAQAAAHIARQANLN